MYVENPRKGMKNYGLSKNGMFLLCLDYIMSEKMSILYNKGVLPSYLINFLLSSQKIYLGSYPKSPATCSSYSLRNMTKYKYRCQVIIFLFLDLFIVGVLFGDWRRENAPTWHCGMWAGDPATAWGTTLGQ